MLVLGIVWEGCRTLKKRGLMFQWNVNKLFGLWIDCLIQGCIFNDG